MNKQKKYWLRGGIISAVISIIPNFFGFLCYKHNDANWFGGLECLPNFFSITYYYFANLYYSFEHYTFWKEFLSYYIGNFGTFDPLAFILNTVLCFFIGVIIGWIYGKIKKIN